MLPCYFFTLEKTMFQMTIKISNECHVLDSDFHISNPARIKMKLRNSTPTSSKIFVEKTKFRNLQYNFSL